MATKKTAKAKATHTVSVDGSDMPKGFTVRITPPPATGGEVKGQEYLVGDTPFSFDYADGKTIRQARAESFMRQAMQELGMDLNDENFQETPKRFVKYMSEFLQPYDAAAILKVGFESPAEYHGMVAQANIPFRGLCAHHLAPYLGKCAIGYIPDKRVVGLSKLGRLVRAIGLATPSLQEKQTDQICDTLWESLEPKGVIVVVSAEHTCMGARGLAAPGVPTTTSSVRGIFRDVPAARQEFFDLIKIQAR